MGFRAMHNNNSAEDGPSQPFLILEESASTHDSFSMCVCRDIFANSCRLFFSPINKMARTLLPTHTYMIKSPRDKEIFIMS